jgi:hypothetical protein
VNRSQLVLNARRRAQAASARGNATTSVPSLNCALVTLEYNHVCVVSSIALQRTMAKLTGEHVQTNVVQYVGPVNLKRESGNELFQFRELLKAYDVVAHLPRCCLPYNG